MWIESLNKWKVDAGESIFEPPSGAVNGEVCGCSSPPKKQYFSRRLAYDWELNLVGSSCELVDFGAEAFCLALYDCEYFGFSGMSDDENECFNGGLIGISDRYDWNAGAGILSLADDFFESLGLDNSVLKSYLEWKSDLVLEGEDFE